MKCINNTVSDDDLLSGRHSEQTISFYSLLTHLSLIRLLFFLFPPSPSLSFTCGYTAIIVHIRSHSKQIVCMAPAVNINFYAIAKFYSKQITTLLCHCRPVQNLYIDERHTMVAAAASSSYIAAMTGETLSSDLWVLNENKRVIGAIACQFAYLHVFQSPIKRNNVCGERLKTENFIHKQYRSLRIWCRPFNIINSIWLTSLICVESRLVWTRCWKSIWRLSLLTGKLTMRVYNMANNNRPEKNRMKSKQVKIWCGLCLF